MPSSVSPYARLLGLRGDLRIAFIDSPALADNPLGDPSTRPVVAYLPPGYDDEGSKRYPVIYVLHGYTGDAAASIGARPWETNVVQWADRLTVAGAMKPTIVVAVDGFSRLGGSQYVDSIHNGAYATYVTRDVVTHVDATYRTIASEGGRAVTGKSSGGFGAMHLPLRHPGVYCAFASHSGDSYFRYAHPISFPAASRTLEGHGNDVRSFVEAFEKKPKRGQAEYQTIEMLGYAAAYSPRSATPFDLDLPWNPATGAIEEDVFARWRAYDPVEEAPRRAAELARLRLRYLDCGRRDEYGLDVGAREMARVLRELGLDVRHEEFDDDHRNVGYRYAVSLPALSEVLENE
ncbi:MAG TPA: alpha/beta hydrolase-fold protein [Candidatus Baltobacteraceae bacterium]